MREDKQWAEKTVYRQSRLTYSLEAQKILDKHIEKFKRQIDDLARRNAYEHQRTVISEVDVEVALVSFYSFEAIKAIVTKGRSLR
jgi:hypothetical protein